MCFLKITRIRLYQGSCIEAPLQAGIDNLDRTCFNYKSFRRLQYAKSDPECIANE